MNTTAISAQRVPAASAFHAAFVVAWAFCLLFYFMEYVVRSAPSVMLPELTRAFGLTTVGLSSLIGLYYYTYALFAVLAGAAVDRWGAKYALAVGVLILAVGTSMFGLSVSWIAGIGRVMQGSRTRCASVDGVVVGAVDLEGQYL